MQRWLPLALTGLILMVLAGCAGSPARVALSVERLGEGDGAVTSTPEGIDCGPEAERCSAEFAVGSSVTLGAQASQFSSFAGWGGACGGSAECTVVMDEPKTVSASFERTRYLLELEIAGAGAGGVRIVPPDETCQESCRKDYRPGTDVSLLATPDEGSSFVGWSGACTGNGLCELKLDRDHAVTAEFTLPPPSITRFTATPETILAGDSARLEWEVVGEGTLSLEILPNLGDVSGRSSARVSPSDTTTYTLTASSEYGSDDSTAQVTVQPSAALTVEVEGPGRVLSVLPSTNDIECGLGATACFKRYPVGQRVTLEAEGSVATWAGCSPSGATCTLTLDESKTVMVTFR